MQVEPEAPFLEMGYILTIPIDIPLCDPIKICEKGFSSSPYGVLQWGGLDSSLDILCVWLVLLLPLLCFIYI